MSGFDLDGLRRVLDATTALLRKGEEVSSEKNGPINVVTIDAMPHESEVDRSDAEVVNCTLCSVSVSKSEAPKFKDDLIRILSDYPDADNLAKGPSYIHVGAEIGDQGDAFRLFALGKVLGLWNVITPETMGFEGQEAWRLAGGGFVMITGWRKP